MAPDRQSALDALATGRPDVDRLERAQGAPAIEAHVRAAWDAVQSALRALLGEHGAELGDMALIREARQRRLIGLDVGNALAAFHSIRERLEIPGYEATEADILAARSGFQMLEAGLADGEAPVTEVRPSQPTPAEPASASAAIGAAGPSPPVAKARKGRRRWAVIGGVAALALIAAWLGLRGSGTNPMLQRAIDDYSQGRRDTAAAEFQSAARADPRNPEPHVFLARIARENGRFSVANDELQEALRLQPANETARREMGSLLLAEGNYDLARTFYVHALEIDQNDRSAQGWLGCALIRLGRTSEGLNWLDRAGDGPWSACRQTSNPPTSTGSRAKS